MKYYLDVHALIEIDMDSFPSKEVRRLAEDKIEQVVLCNRENMSIIEIGTKIVTEGFEIEED